MLDEDTPLATPVSTTIRPERADGGVWNEHFFGVEVGAVTLRAARRPSGFAKNRRKRWSLQRLVEKFTGFCDRAAGDAGKKSFIGMSGLANHLVRVAMGPVGWRETAPLRKNRV
jgi:hypothetical protein